MIKQDIKNEVERMQGLVPFAMPTISYVSNKTIMDSHNGYSSVNADYNFQKNEIRINDICIGDDAYTTFTIRHEIGHLVQMNNVRTNKRLNDLYVKIFFVDISKIATHKLISFWMENEGHSSNELFANCFAYYFSTNYIEHSLPKTVEKLLKSI